MRLECNHGMIYRSLLLRIGRPVNHHHHRGKVGLVVGVALGLLALLAFVTFSFCFYFVDTSFLFDCLHMLFLCVDAYF